MRAIICGAGQVGYNIAAYLAKEENDVTVIDLNPKLISQINDDMDVNGIVGHASNPDVLNNAGANDADMIIAVTQSDEVNMVACQISHSLFGVPKKIARIREQAYLQPAWSNLFSRAHMPIDEIISPEVVIADDIFKRMEVPGTTYVAPLAEGQVQLIGMLCSESCPVIKTPLKQLNSLFPNLAFKVVVIIRNNKAFIPEQTEQILPGDEVFVVVDARHLKRTMIAFGHEETASRNIVIAGGGNIGLVLAKKFLERGRGVQVKIIEKDPERALQISQELENVIVLQGNSLDRDIFEDAGIQNTETFIAVTNDDESNILGSLLAKQFGCKSVVTLVNNSVYSSLVGPLGIDTIISPRAIIVGTVMQHVRRGKIKGLYNIRDEFAEVIEAEVSDACAIANKSIAELNLPQDVTVAALIRDQEVIISPEGIDITPGDSLIILCSQEKAQKVEKMLSVQVDLF